MPVGESFPQSSFKAKKQAAQLRRAMSPPEIILWRALHEHGLQWHMFHQWPIRGFIVDFWFPRFQLVVEVDGKHHEKLDRIEKDEYRDWILGEQGILTMRIKAAEVLRDVEPVMERIEATLEARYPLDVRPMHY